MTEYPVILFRLEILKEQLQTGAITIDEFNNEFREAVRVHKASLTDQEKAAVFDRLIDSCTAGMTESEELHKGRILVDSDSMHYAWEELMQALYGNKFFQFYNGLYESY